jgi:hypothetical protein
MPRSDKKQVFTKKALLANHVSGEFTATDQERAGYRRYLQVGGFLIPCGDEMSSLFVSAMLTVEPSDTASMCDPMRSKPQQSVLDVSFQID